ncbi:MAG: lamin tail domain-containing protein [Akkermansiaceae bacterium]|nr:lamin tail domain-containing protein [Akkermansiaceae bacterium]
MNRHGGASRIGLEGGLPIPRGQDGDPSGPGNLPPLHVLRTIPSHPGGDYLSPQGQSRRGAAATPSPVGRVRPRSAHWSAGRIELHNTGPAAVSLTGWHLTDDPGNLTKWTFPDGAATTMATGQYLVIFASGVRLNAANRPVDSDFDAGGRLHADFKLNTAEPRPVRGRWICTGWTPRNRRGPIRPRCWKRQAMVPRRPGMRTVWPGPAA